MHLAFCTAIKGSLLLTNRAKHKDNGIMQIWIFTNTTKNRITIGNDLSRQAFWKQLNFGYLTESGECCAILHFQIARGHSTIFMSQRDHLFSSSFFLKERENAVKYQFPSVSFVIERDPAADNFCLRSLRWTRSEKLHFRALRISRMGVNDAWRGANTRSACLQRASGLFGDFLSGETSPCADFELSWD